MIHIYKRSSPPVGCKQLHMAATLEMMMLQPTTNGAAGFKALGKKIRAKSLFILQFSLSGSLQKVVLLEMVVWSVLEDDLHGDQVLPPR